MMSSNEALRLLYDVCRTMKATAEDHDKIRDAAQILVHALNPVPDAAIPQKERREDVPERGERKARLKAALGSHESRAEQIEKRVKKAEAGTG